MQKLPSKTKAKLNKGLIYIKDKKSTLLFDSSKSELITLNETASFIYSKLSRAIGPERIARAMIKKFDISQDVALKDVDSFIQTLKEKRIITYV